jgi:signal transduction histidine kinase
MLAVALGRLLAQGASDSPGGAGRHRDQLIALAPALHPDYADDARLGRWRCLSTRPVTRNPEPEKLFTSDVSELRTPLMILASSCELLLATLRWTRSTQVKRIARRAEMRQLVETFLMLARKPEELGTESTCTLKSIADAQVEIWGRLIGEKSGVYLRAATGGQAR